MSDNPSSQSLWEKLENLPGYRQAALAGVFIPLAGALLGTVATAIFPITSFPMLFLGVPLGIFGLAFSIIAALSGYRRRMSSTFAWGLSGFVLSGLLEIFCLNFLSFLFGGLGGC